MAEARTKPETGVEVDSPPPATLGAAEDRRGERRVDVVFPAEANGVVLWTTNASRGGMQLRCPALVFGLLQPHVETGKLYIQLRVTDQRSIALGCAVVYLAHYGYDYLLGVRLANVTAGDYALYRQHCLGEAASPSHPLLPRVHGCEREETAA